MTQHYSPRAERGAVLIVSLLFLVVLTMLGITAMTGTTFEERMAGNARDTAVAQRAAEASLRSARQIILGLRTIPCSGAAILNKSVNTSNWGNATGVTSTTNGSCTCGVCTPRTYDTTNASFIPPDIPAGVTWTESDIDGGATTASYQTTSTDKLIGVSKQPRFISELFCPRLAGNSIEGQTDSCKMFRFTAVGWGKNPNTQVTVQEFYISSNDQ